MSHDLTCKNIIVTKERFETGAQQQKLVYSKPFKKTMDLECAVSELVLISSKTVSPTFPFTITLKMILLRSTYRWVFMVPKELYVKNSQ